MATHVIVLAAGKGVRMNSDRAKVLHRAAGRPLVSWACDQAASLEPASTIVVIGHQADEVAAVLPPGTTTAIQAEQNGTGHATGIGLAAIDTQEDDTVVVLPGDMPLILAATLRRLVDSHHSAAAAATVLTVRADDPTGYGRVIRADDQVVRIVEERDATDAERAVDEINTSVYAFRAGDLTAALRRISIDNDQGELYLTDAIEILVAEGRPVGSVIAEAGEGTGVNTIEQLAAVSAELERRATRPPTAE